MLSVILLRLNTHVRIQLTDKDISSNVDGRLGAADSIEQASPA
jgi:hypothetical protein